MGSEDSSLALGMTVSFLVVLGSKGDSLERIAFASLSPIINELSFRMERSEMRNLPDILLHPQAKLNWHFK